LSKFYITGTRRGLGKALEKKYGNCDSLDECDIFINCKHNGFAQIDLLYKAADLNKRTISIGSYASDWIFHPNNPQYKYAIEKNALRDANSQLFDNGFEVTCLNFGYFDTERSKQVQKNKMSIDYVIDVIDWVLQQPHRIKEVTITPSNAQQVGK
jgi:hypothetical protein